MYHEVAHAGVGKQRSCAGEVTDLLRQILAVLTLSGASVGFRATLHYHSAKLTKSTCTSQVTL